MTDRPAPLSDDDLSADLDDEAGIDVRARVAGDPTAAARQEELARARRFLADAPVPVLDDEQVDRLVTTSLAVAPGPRRRTRGPAPWLVAAAVAALVAVGLTLVWSGRTTGDEDASGSAATTVAEAGADVADEAAGSATDRDGASTDAPPSVEGSVPSAAESATGSTAGAIDLGSFPTADDLREALATSFVPAPGTEGEPATEPPDQAALDRCEQQLQITLELDSDPLSTGFALVDGQLVLVYEWDHRSFVDGEPTTLVTAVGRDACDEVALFER